MKMVKEVADSLPVDKSWRSSCVRVSTSMTVSTFFEDRYFNGYFGPLWKHKYEFFIIGQMKAKKPRGDKRVLICPFVNCLKDFTETGNLKTHLRTHVSAS